MKELLPICSIHRVVSMFLDMGLKLRRLKERYLDGNQTRAGVVPVLVFSDLLIDGGKKY
jgi:hypothetical protein